MKDLQKKNKIKKSQKIDKSKASSENNKFKDKILVYLNFLTSFIKVKIWGLYIFPLISLLIILFALTVYDLVIKNQIAIVTPLKIQSVNLTNYPYIANDLNPQITAESALIYDDTAKVMLYEKKPFLRFSMASTTKIMTALVALEHFKNTDLITIQNTFKEGAIIGFPQGEQLLFEDILYALLLPSANDAAHAIADNYPGGDEKFVIRMNEKAAELKLYYTHYADPSGLDDDGNYTTIGDLAKLASYALKNEEFTRIIATKSKTIISINPKNTYILYNLNKLLGENGVIGMKTGYTQGAGEVLVTTKIEKNHTFIIVVLKSENRFEDTQVLMRYISDNIKFINPNDYLTKP